MKLSVSALFCLTILILSISSTIAQPGRQGSGQNNSGQGQQSQQGSQNGDFGNQTRQMGSQSGMNQEQNGGLGSFGNQNNNGTRQQGQQGGSQNGPMSGGSSFNQSGMVQQQNGGFGNQNNNQGQQNQQGPQGSQNGGFGNQSAMGQQQNGGFGGFGNQNNNGTRQQGQQGPSGIQDGGFGKQNDTRALPTDQSGFGERQGPGANLTSASSETSFATGFLGHFMVSLVIIMIFGFVISVLFYRQELKKNGTAPFAAPSFCPKTLYPAVPLAHENIIEVDDYKFQAHPLIEEGEGYDKVL